MAIVLRFLMLSLGIMECFESVYTEAERADTMVLVMVRVPEAAWGRPEMTPVPFIMLELFTSYPLILILLILLADKGEKIELLVYNIYNISIRKT